MGVRTGVRTGVRIWAREGRQSADSKGGPCPLLRLQGVRHPLLLQQHRRPSGAPACAAREGASGGAGARAPGAAATGMLEAAQGELGSATQEVSLGPWAQCAVGSPLLVASKQAGEWRKRQGGCWRLHKGSWSAPPKRQVDGV